MCSVINILIIFFIILLFYQILLKYYESNIVEGMLDVVPTFEPVFSPDMSPTAAPTNEMLPNLTINQVYRQYDKKIADNTFLMAQQNAGNIEYLKQRIDAVQGMYSQVQDLSGNVDALQTQVNGLISAQQQYATQMTGGTAPNITGATTSDDTTGTSSTSTSNLVTS
jgi:outer membrane murein-binding lipoprotein Lpp